MNRNEKYTSARKIRYLSSVEHQMVKYQTLYLQYHFNHTNLDIYMRHVLTNVDIIFNNGLMDRLTIISVSCWPSYMTQKLCTFFMADTRT